MNVIYQLIFFILFAVLTRGNSQEQPKTAYKEGQRFFYLPDSNGQIHLIDAEEKFDHQRFLIKKDFNLYLYTRNNQMNPHTIINGDSATLWSSYFDGTKPVKIIVHGWAESGNSEINREIKDAFLQVLDVNVIVMDWGKGAGGLYPVAALNVPAAGEYLAEVLDWLVAEGVPAERIHLVGHSMGAHVAGIAGRSMTKGRVLYISGLDPAYPLWWKGSNRIRATDAGYVEIIHTDAGALGVAEPIGHNDFYPNGGSRQPGCSILDLGCAHKRSWKYFADSLDHTGFRAIQCTDYSEMIRGRCADLSSMHMGGSEPKPAVGIFYLKTNKNKPYYQG